MLCQPRARESDHSHHQHMYFIQRQFKSTSNEHHVLPSLKWTESSADFARVINFNTES